MDLSGHEAFRTETHELDGTPKHASDLWLQMTVKLHGAQYLTDVAGHGVQILRVRE
jgi:hypothetical protein